MVAGLATISGNTLVVYATLIAPVVPDAAGQLLTASLISAPGRGARRAADDPPEREAAGAAPRRRRARRASTTAPWTRWCAARRTGWRCCSASWPSLIVFVALVALANAALEPLDRPHPAAARRLAVLAARLGHGRAGGGMRDRRAAARRQGGGQRVRRLSGTGRQRRRRAWRSARG